MRRRGCVLYTLPALCHSDSPRPWCPPCVQPGVGANYRLAGKHGSADASVPPQIDDYNLFVYARPLCLRTVCKYESRRNTEKKDGVTLASEPAVVSRSLVGFAIAQEGVQWVSYPSVVATLVTPGRQS